MKVQNWLSYPKETIGLFEHIAIQYAALIDASHKTINPVAYADSERMLYVSPWILKTIRRYIVRRNTLIEYYVVFLDCHTVGQFLCDCPHTETCILPFCHKTWQYVSNSVSRINRLVSIGEAEQISIGMTSIVPGQNLPAHIVLANQKKVRREQAAKMIKTVDLLSTKIRLIESTRTLFEAEFSVYLNRISLYWRYARMQCSELPVNPPTTNELAVFVGEEDLVLGSLTAELKSAIEQRDHILHLLERESNASLAQTTPV